MSMKNILYCLALASINLSCVTSPVSYAHTNNTKNLSTDRGFQKVIWIVLENTNASDAIKEPFLNELAQRGALLEQMRAETHPSQGNYIAMIAGDTLGVFGDGDVNLNATHLGDLLESHGRTWKNYAEDYPGNCFLGSTKNNYARKHVPFLSFTNITNNPQRCANVVNSSQFSEDLASANLPDFSFYTPDMINDGHDSNITTAAKYLEEKFGALLRDQEFMKDKLFVITFDESETYFSNHIYTVLIGSKVRPGSRSSQKLNHISLLRLIEDEWGLGSLNRQDRNATPPEGIWQ